MRSPGRDCKGRKTNGPNTEPYSMPTLPSVKEKNTSKRAQKGNARKEENNRVCVVSWDQDENGTEGRKNAADTVSRHEEG